MPGGHADDGDARLSRRRLFKWGAYGAAAAVGAGAALFELVDHSVLPGHQELITLLGQCDVPPTPLSFGTLGPAKSGTFESRARNTTVGYTIAYPPGHAPGDALPLVVAMHGFGVNHNGVLSSMSLAQALALRVGGASLPPMAMVAADGGGGYWHPHKGDDPLGMVVNELVPMCQALGLGVPPQPIGAVGVSMGGYGVLNMAEHEPHIVRAVAAISPAVWTSYNQAKGANAGAFASAADFAANDVIANAGALRDTAVRVSSGLDDPFHPGVEALLPVLPSGAEVDVRTGCHGGAFFTSAEPAALAFLGRHLSV